HQNTVSMAILSVNTSCSVGATGSIDSSELDGKSLRYARRVCSIPGTNFSVCAWPVDSGGGWPGCWAAAHASLSCFHGHADHELPPAAALRIQVRRHEDPNTTRPV